MWVCVVESDMVDESAGTFSDQLHCSIVTWIEGNKFAIKSDRIGTIKIYGNFLPEGLL
jgi:hypothetical protein